MKRLIFGTVMAAFALSACSSLTLLRTKEMQAVGDDVKKDVTQEMKLEMATMAAANKARMDSLETVIDSLLLVQKRMKVELAMLSSKVADMSDRSDSHHEELLYRLDLLIGKSDKILSKKVVVNGQAISQVDSAAISAEKMQTLDSLFNTARADYHKGEIKLAYSGFKQIYEETKTGNIASEALFWMGVCLSDAGQADKAKVVFAREVKQFPDASKTCAALLKLANIAALEGDTKLQKQYLQKILATKSCSDSNEFLQAAEMLEAILDGTVTEPHPVSDSTAKPVETSADSTQSEVKAPQNAEAKVAEIKEAKVDSTAQLPKDSLAVKIPADSSAIAQPDSAKTISEKK